MMSKSTAEQESIPQQLKDGLWVFPPNLRANRCISWWLDCHPEPVLIDCPPLNSETLGALKTLSSGRSCRILLTNRESHGRVRELQESFGWPVLVQEQEAYLLPGLSELESFGEEHMTTSGVCLLWTPGPTPGSCVVYARSPWNVLFCGRLLIHLDSGRLSSVHGKSTFHWTRQQKSLKKLRNWVPLNSLPQLASGVGHGRSVGSELLPWEAWQEGKDLQNQ